MRVTARGDYAVRAAVELAAAGGASRKVAEIAEAQGIPPRFLENIMLALRRTGLAQSRRGADGGFRLACPPERITLADVLRAVEGPLANVQGIPPDALSYTGPTEPLRDVWVAVRASLRVVLERVTLADVVNGTLPDDIRALIDDPEAWRVHVPQPQRSAP
ncbi:MAG: RrF2 family transcriptional regulator [Solirubrobacteraceae bacterium]